MKLQIVSDLHLEFFPNQPDFIGFDAAPEADALVIAGDIHVRTKGVDRFKGWPVPVIYVYGNHEMYSGHDLGETVKDLRAACADSQVHFLETDVLVLPGFPEVRFLGTCLWTDYLLFGRGKQALAMYECGKTLADHARIRSNGKRFEPRDAMFRHVESKRWLNEQFAAPFDGKTVVVTHHGCHWNSVADKYKADLVSAGFSSDLTAMLDHADVWIHGHTHFGFQYQVGRARVVVNPRGYPLRTGNYENVEFNPQLVVEV